MHFTGPSEAAAYMQVPGNQCFVSLFTGVHGSFRDNIAPPRLTTRKTTATNFCAVATKHEPAGHEPNDGSFAESSVSFEKDAII